MTIPVDSAVSSLTGTARARPPDARLERRLEEIQRVLGDDLLWVERGLAEAVELGPTPGIDAARHLVSRGGKRVRPLALLLSAGCFGPIPPAARELAVVAELVHSATLLHDDVVDEGTERRGAPAARRLFGNAVSVLAGDLLLVNALERTIEHAPDVLPDLVLTLRRLVDGEIVQLRGRTELDVSEATYERVLRDKTASLFAWAARTGARLARASAADQERMSGFGERLGMAFQLVDDVIDYSGERTGKTLLGDLREGKLTLPLVLAVARHPELREPLSRIHAGDQEPVEAVSRRVVDSGACEEARRRARRFTDSAIEALRGVSAGPARALLEAVTHQLADRAS
jgi:octaprenyl-diphosphate synthase